MNDICKQETDKVLLVEGINDCHVVLALCTAHNVPENFGIFQCGQDAKVLKRLNALIASSNSPKAIGIVIDADNPSLSSRWDSIRGKLSHYTYKLPAVPDAQGTIVRGSSDEPDLGFWLMPNNKDSGILEDFCAELAEPSSLLFAKECVNKASERNKTTFKEVHYSKAVIHTYLAWQDAPGSPLGIAISKQALRPHTDIALVFKDWLIELFS